MNHFFFTLKEACSCQIFYYKGASLFWLESSVFFRNVFVHASIWSKKIDYFKIVSLTYFPVVRVVGRSNLYHTSSKFHINIIICDNWNFFSCERKLQHFSNDRLIAFILRIYGNGSITKESFRTSCCNFNLSASISIFIIKVIHCPLSIFVVYFIISKSSTTARTPVYKALTTVHKSALIQSYENVANCGRQAFIIGKALSIPVCRVTKLFLLFYDSCMMIFLYLPGAFQELLAAKIVTGKTFFFKLTFNNILSCNSGVVCTCKPESIVALHTVIANYDILESIVKTVSHVENTGYVWRRNDDRISICFFVAVCTLAFVLFMYRRLFIRRRFKISLAVPFIVNSVFERFRLVSLFQFNCFHLSSSSSIFDKKILKKIIMNF